MVEHGGKSYVAYILKVFETDAVQLFVGADGDHYFISEKVPKLYREPQLLHEIVEHTELKGMVGRCKEAAKIELGNIPKEDLICYLSYRIQLFDKLIEVHALSDPERAEEMRKTQAHYIEMRDTVK